MKTYIGVKEIKAKPMTLQEYCDYRGWELPKDVDGSDKVYLVEYSKDPDSKQNHPDHEGYISMSPKHVFDKAYRENVPLEKLENPEEMTTYQIGVVEKAYELDDDIDKLENRLITPEFAELEKDEQGRLKSQLLAMKAYLTILIDRINNFEIKK